MKSKGIAIHQLLKTIVPGDAISQHTLSIQQILQKAGFQSEIFVETCHPDLVGMTYSLEHLTSMLQPEDILLFHFSQGTPIANKVLKLTVKIVLIYHNITPEKFFRRTDHSTWLSLIEGRQQLPLLAKKAVLGLADSEYNRLELVTAGCQRTDVLPILIDFNIYNVKSNKMVMNIFSEKQTTFLFVGRVTANKGHERLLKFFYYYKKLEPSARMIIVGQYYGFEPYLYRLKQLMKQLRLEDVYFVGHVSHQELCSYYRLADVFLCLSSHEGFCVPLLESMYFQLPILALSGTAIDDTLSNAGIIFEKFDALFIAETANRIVRDNSFKMKILSLQNQRLRHFDKSRIENILLNNLKSLI